MTEQTPSIAIDWTAPIIPSVSLAGIAIGLSADAIEHNLSRYLMAGSEDLYRFEHSPVLQLKRSQSAADDLFVFSVHDMALTNWRLRYDSPEHPAVNPRALGIIIRNGKVHAVKAWQFEYVEEGQLPTASYQGKLPGNVGLGADVSELLAHAELHYDDAEEVLYTGPEYGGLEITGYGSLDDYPEQPILAIAVIPEG